LREGASDGRPERRGAAGGQSADGSDGAGNRSVAAS
jgi:hypothetical protein